MRVNTHKESEEVKLYTKLRMLNNNEEANKEVINEVVEAIAKVAEAEYKHVIGELDMMKPEEGRIDAQKFWRMKKKLFPKRLDPPSAMLDKDGNMLKTKTAIEKRALEVYSERLKANSMKEHLKGYEDTNNQLCFERLKETKLVKTNPWSLDDLEQAVKDLGKKQIQGCSAKCQ